MKLYGVKRSPFVRKVRIVRERALPPVMEYLERPSFKTALAP